MTFVWSNQTKVKNGVHNIPTAFLAPVADLPAEKYHYWDLDWTNPIAGVFNPATSLVPGQEQYYQQLRQQVSLNTCQGCHAGENKTIFTHVAPLRFGEAANYWAATPSTRLGDLDHRFMANSGKNDIDGGTPVWNNPNPGSFDGTVEHLQNVSAFLTGRRYSGTAGATTWDDDWDNNTLDPGDDGMLDLFEVYAPNNNLDQTLPDFQARYGYNDLERRAKDLCTFVSTGCGSSFSDLVLMATAINMHPFAIGMH